MADDSTFKRLIEIGHEERFLEFKGPAGWLALKYKIVKTAMGMANIRDGGYLIVGIKQNDDGTFEPQGLSDEELASYNEDHINASTNEFADPYVRIRVDKIEYNNQNYILLSVQEFDDIPVICKKDYDRLLRKGAIYTRSNRMVETSEINTQTEMREILDLAGFKEVRKRLEYLSDLGLLPAKEVEEAASEEFDKQIGDILDE